MVPLRTTFGGPLGCQGDPLNKGPLKNQTRLSQRKAGMYLSLVKVGLGEGQA